MKFGSFSFGSLQIDAKSMTQQNSPLILRNESALNVAEDVRVEDRLRSHTAQKDNPGSPARAESG